jgi:peptide/nickel transport system permease protein
LRRAWSAIHAALARHHLVHFTLRRLVAGIGILVLASVLIFAGTNGAGGNVAQRIVGREGTPAQIAQLQETLHLNRPLSERYWDWLKGFVHGDLGRSAATTIDGSNTPVRTLIGQRLKNTLILAGFAFIIWVPLSLGFGILAAARAGRRVDHVVSGFSLGIVSLPEFVIGSLLIVLLGGSVFNLFPPVVILHPGQTPLSNLNELALPVLTLVIFLFGAMMRMVRAGMVEVLRSGYVEMARLDGLSERRVLTRYALRNGFAPTVIVLAWSTAHLIGSTVVVETIFNYPGIGQFLVSSVAIRDVPVVQSICMIIAVIYTVLYLLADLAVVLLIPKLRTGAR